MRASQQIITLLGGVKSYLGIIATSTYIPNAIAGAGRYTMTRKRHYTRTGFSSAQLVYPNWYVNASGGTGAETGSGTTLALNAWIEYPIGTYTQVTFGGSNTSNIASGTSGVSDACAVTIPAGAKFYTWTYVPNFPWLFVNITVGGSKHLDTSDGEACNSNGAGPAGVPSAPGAITDNRSALQSYGPCMIIGQTTKPSLILPGDSRSMGEGDVIDSAGDTGELARSIGPSLNYANFGISGDRVQWLAASNSMRSALFQYASGFLTNYGINDLNNSRTALQVNTDFATMRALAPTKQWVTVTLAPKTTSTDSWVTPTIASGGTPNNQTKMGNDAARVSVNTTRRTGALSGFACFDIAPVSEYPTDTGYWIGATPAITVDGTHQSAAQYLAIKNSGIITPATFHR
ncbi:hypothetical protein ACVWZ4_007231 [Bradyrhizobium sp. USDA 4472]